MRAIMSCSLNISRSSVALQRGRKDAKKTQIPFAPLRLRVKIPTETASPPYKIMLSGFSSKRLYLVDERRPLRAVHYAVVGG